MSKFWAFLTKKRYFNWPYLDFYLQIPFITVGAHVMVRSLARDTYEFIGATVKVWRWSWTFRLYQPNKARYMK